MTDKEKSAQDVKEEKEREGRELSITVPTPDPKLNPASPDFDFDAYQKAVEAAGGLSYRMFSAAAEMSESLDSIAQKMTGFLSQPETAEMLKASTLQNMADISDQAINAAMYAAENLQPVIDLLKAFMTDEVPGYRKWVEHLKEEEPYSHFTRILALADNMPFIVAGLSGFVDMVSQLGNYLEDELARPDYEGLAMTDMLQPLKDDPDSSLWERAVANAEEAMQAAEPERYRAMVEARESWMEDFVPEVQGEVNINKNDAWQQNEVDETRRAEAITAKQPVRLPPLPSMPNGEILNFLFRIFSQKNGRLISQLPTNRHEEVTVQKKGNKMRFSRVNKQSGTAVIVEIDQADTYLKKINKTFKKLLRFSLQKMTAQNFPLVVGFSLNELVELKMYTNTDSARKAVKNFFEQQKQTTISGIVKKGKKHITEEGGILFYHYKIDDGYVRLWTNENLNMEFIAPYFTVYPLFAYSLSNNASELVGYIFFLARQNSKAIKDKGTFTISLDSIRAQLGIPSIDEVKNRKYRQFIIDPIEQAIEEIEKALENVPEARDYGFTMTPHGTDTSNISEWLKGYLEIGLNGDFAETFVKLATKAEKDRERWEKAKLIEKARQVVKAEAKEEKEADKGNLQKAN